ncbi:choline/ethanolamine kinase [Pochonia chlamydosporia 170]|uniref:Choline/ethanolamine kinase n=1 Tax=Pochonia chlamydosporia 170 TaxID=1380566 RepID=A0A179FH96_METCM|nr:choline/ethanolamine kinase [Pochonia chlamydosporia 170]OAQ64708.1 choline/ethanolamine kinase [Pochonia chlamydosporia 170]
MSALTRVPVTLPQDGVPTEPMVRDIIGTFLTREWPLVNPETLIMSYNASFANAHCSVERPPPTSGAASEPLKVFIKFHKTTLADIDIFKHMVPNKEAEALLCHEYGQSGLGAKVFGFFETLDGTLGRIDEFLDARNMEPQDVEDEAIRADVATALATFHAMEAPLEKKPVDLYYDAISNGLKKYHGSNNLKALGMEGGINIDKLIDYDFASRLGIIVNKMQSLGSKAGWCIHDVQFMNVLVKNSFKEDESRVVLIDFEFVMRNYRAFDIGGHFMQKLFKWFDEENKIANCRKYTEQEKRHFCGEYARQWNSLTGDNDSEEKVFLESEYGYMVAITFDIHNMLCYMNDVEGKDPLDLLGLNKLFDEFVTQYEKLGLDTE